MKTSALARAAAVAAAVVALAGCAYVNPITTSQDYEASDGLQVQVGDIKALNLLVVTTAEGAPAVLTGTLHNAGSESIVASLSIDGTTTEDVTVEAGTSVTLGVEDGQSLVTGASPAGPGHIAQVSITTEQEGTVPTPVPVVDGTLPEYAPVLEAVPAS